MENVLSLVAAIAIISFVICAVGAFIEARRAPGESNSFDVFNRGMIFSGIVFAICIWRIIKIIMGL